MLADKPLDSAKQIDLVKQLGPVKQWGYLVRDLDEAMDCWINQLGVGPWWGYRNVPAKAQMGGVQSD